MKRAARSLLDTFPWRPITSPGTPCDSWKTREAEWEKTRPQRRKATLDRLREVFKEGERGLTGWDQILDWLHDHGFRNREGRPVNERTVRGWMKRLGCPILRGCRAFPGRTRSSAPESIKTSDSAASWYLGRPLSVLRVIEGSARLHPKPNGPLPEPES